MASYHLLPPGTHVFIPAGRLTLAGQDFTCWIAPAFPDARFVFSNIPFQLDSDSYACHSRERVSWKRRDCFVAALLAMTKSGFTCHCERFGESRGNLNRHDGSLATGPKAWIQGFTLFFNFSLFISISSFILLNTTYYTKYVCYMGIIPHNMLNIKWIMKKSPWDRFHKNTSRLFRASRQFLIDFIEMMA